MNSRELNKILEEARERQENEDWLREMEEAWYEEEFCRDRDFKDVELLPRVAVASADDYMDWLRGYLQQGGEVTHVYDYKFPDGFFVALENLDFRVPLYGSQSINIIVPAGLEVTGDVGHCQLYFMDGYRKVGGVVPIYKDISF